MLPRTMFFNTRHIICYRQGNLNVLTVKQMQPIRCASIFVRIPGPEEDR